MKKILIFIFCIILLIFVFYLGLFILGNYTGDRLAPASHPLKAP